MKALRMGSRGSKLALVQTHEVQQTLTKAHPGISVSIQVIKTIGDRESEVPFSAIGAKGVFTKELDEALLAERIDCATHSLKDLPSDLTKGVKLAAVSACIDPRDALVSRDNVKFSRLPEGSRIGTSSLRRAALLKRIRPDLVITELRGNVDTRLRKLDEGQVDAIVLAAAGLKRLGLGSRVTEFLDPHDFVPAIGQGLLAIVCRAKDFETQKLLAVLDDPSSHRMADAQRLFMAAMEGGCRVPLGCYAEETGDRVRLIGFLATPDGKREIRESVEGTISQVKVLAENLAQRILKKGGDEILRGLRAEVRS
ncbi:MAG: hydroxymethylbilane synthase [Pseudomonadota bacterium]